MFAIARYSPSYEKLKALIAFLRESVSAGIDCSFLHSLASGDCPSTYPFTQIEHIHNGVLASRCKIPREDVSVC